MKQIFDVEVKTEVHYTLRVFAKSKSEAKELARKAEYIDAYETGRGPIRASSASKSEES